jgi:argininosuccinate lyase
MSNLWGGRFAADMDDAVKRLNDSFAFDVRLWKFDIQGSLAYAGALERAGVLTADESRAIRDGLAGILVDVEAGRSQFDPSAEDVHSAVEGMLRERIGPVAGKLHTGRSRNDQIATDTRLYLRSSIEEILFQLASLQETVLSKAEEEIDTVLPGLTHLQHAQPVLLAHHLMAYFWMLQRDRERLLEIRKRVNVLPLGSAALAGSTVPLDRRALAAALGFEDVSRNSMDAVSDRDYLVEFLAAGSLIGVHLSRFAEEIILWNTPEFSFIDLHDAVTTGSSIMPQKKNPDVAELARGKPGRLIGHLVAMLTVVKGLPLAYNKDLQEDKEGLFDTVDTLVLLLPAFNKMIATSKFNRDRMGQALYGDFSTTTDLADVLVKRGMPFREAHEVIGRLVRHCIDISTPLEELDDEALASFSPLLVKAPRGKEAIQASLGAREVIGGTGPKALREQISLAKESISV